MFLPNSNMAPSSFSLNSLFFILCVMTAVGMSASLAVVFMLLIMSRLLLGEYAPVTSKVTFWFFKFKVVFPHSVLMFHMFLSFLLLKTCISLCFSFDKDNNSFFIPAKSFLDTLTSPFNSLPCL